MSADKQDEKIEYTQSRLPDEPRAGSFQVTCSHCGQPVPVTDSVSLERMKQEREEAFKQMRAGR